MIVADWPTLTVLMSDSLSATVIDIEPVFTISANGELELLDEDDDELEPPRLPADAEPPAAPPVPVPEEELDEELELLLALPVEPADTASPGERLASDTIVPLVGAYSLVLLRAVWALLTLTSALSTEAWAEAMLAGEGVVVVGVELEEERPELFELFELELEGSVVVDLLGDGREVVVGVVEVEGVLVGLVLLRASETNSVVGVWPV